MTNSQLCNIDYTKVIQTLVAENPHRYSREIRNNSAISEWLSKLYPFTTYIPEQVYALLHPDDNAFCKSGNKRKFRNINAGWNKCSDPKCNNCLIESTLKAKQTCLTKYGVDNPMKVDSIKNKVKHSTIKNNGYESAEIKRKQYYLNKYGVDHYWKTNQGQQSRKQSLLINYGVTNPSHSPIIQQHKKNVFLEKYGVDHPMKTPEIKNKCVQTFIAKYNVSNPSKLSSVRDKAMDTMYNRHGYDCYINFSKKAQETCIRKYGIAHPAQLFNIKEKSVTIKKNNFFQNLNIRNNYTSIPEFTCNNYAGVNYTYNWKCSTCQSTFTDHINNGNIPRCTICNPRVGIAGISEGENELALFVKSLGVNVTLNSRSIINPKEIDIYIPSHKLAIEYNGVYYHSEIAGNKSKYYHINKTNSCKSKDITLMHVYDIEWNTKQDIVKSRIAQKLGISTKIYARKCVIKDITTNDAYMFLNMHHIQGVCASSINFGLFFKDELVAVMTFGKSRYNKIAKYELLRFCSKINTTVIGGASKLLKHFENKYNAPSIVSYCDLRYNIGTVYSTIGFTLHSQSKPNYKYHKNCNALESRIKFQKHKLSEKLELFDKDKSEWENMKDNGYDRIWDCGNLVFLKNTNI